MTLNVTHRSSSDTPTDTEAPNMKNHGIIISTVDRERLERLLFGELAQAISEKGYLLDLQGELQRARTVDPSVVPADVITMNSTVRLRDNDSGEEETFTLVYPRDANIAVNRLSILAPIGTAILGCRVGDVVQWRVPSGTRCLTVEEVLYQPEREGSLHL
jgi:regulator of nucleoside diphosphate kinase